MPIIRSAKKKLRQDKKREKHNAAVKRDIKNIIKKYKTHPTAKLLSEVYGALDTAIKKKIFHANKASRLKSNFSALLGRKQKSDDKLKTAVQKSTPKKKTSKKSVKK